MDKSCESPNSAFTLSRNFPNGWKVGGYFTLTDAAFADFGEGSFDKGIMFTIPFNSISPYETRYAIHENIRPIQGDGGARVIIPGRLYEFLEQSSKYKLSESWGRVWR